MSSEHTSRQILTCLLAALLFMAGPKAHAQDSLSRLILKDGSYQEVTKYEVKGGRVRYYSAEREEWEELPNDLVDWPATEKYAKDRAAGAEAPEAIQLDKEAEHERELEEMQLPQIAPGLRLPEDTGVFLLDNFQGEPQIVEIQQTLGDINRNTKGNIFRGALNPVAGAKQTIELDGPHAAIQAHVDVPSLYINLDDAPDRPTSDGSSKSGAQSPQQPQQPQQPSVPFDRFRILRTDVKNGKRIVGDVKRQVTGKTTEEQHTVKTTIARVSGGWLKITPIESLASGEYALVEMNGKEGINLYLWDFGVNPKAPPNANPWKPDTKPAPPTPAKPTTGPH